MAGANPTFVDDMRPIGSSPEECTGLHHGMVFWVSSLQPGKLGLQVKPQELGQAQWCAQEIEE
jgi:hypothetical protein